MPVTCSDSTCCPPAQAQPASGSILKPSTRRTKLLTCFASALQKAQLLEEGRRHVHEHGLAVLGRAVEPPVREAVTHFLSRLWFGQGSRPAQ